jgi:acetyl esterase/lipase
MDTTAKPIDAIRQMLLELIGGPDASIAHRREQSTVFARQQPGPPAEVEVTADRLGGVVVERIRSRDGASPMIFLHLHGGGYVMGDPAGSRGFTVPLAVATGGRVLSVDYRLAPEHPFPAAVEDALAVYTGLLASGVDPRTLAVGGESAGGGLALAMLLAARGAGLPMPACAVVMSPWTNLRCDGTSYVTQHGRDPLLTRDVLLEMAGLYLAGAECAQEQASPGLADLGGLPPLLIQVGAEEVLLDDARQLAEHARQRGVDVTFEEWPEMIHVWQMFGAGLPEAGQAMDRIVQFIRRHIDP